MTTTLVEAAAYADVVVPAAGEPRTAASIQAPFQTLTNRTKWLKDEIVEVAAYSSGITKFRQAADITALKAITSSSYADGQVCFVLGYGVYHYTAASAASVSEPWIVKPDDVAGNGRWLHAEYLLKAANSGLATLNSSGKLTSGQLENRIVAMGIASGSYTTTGAEADMTSITTTLTGLLTGDKVFVDFSAGVVGADASTGGLSKLRVVLPDTSTSDHASTASIIGTTTIYLCQALNYTCVQDGSHTFKMRGSLVGGGVSGAWSNIQFRVVAVRP
jgi:hypothetical protein